MRTPRFKKLALQAASETPPEVREALQVLIDYTNKQPFTDHVDTFLSICDDGDCLDVSLVLREY